MKRVNEGLPSRFTRVRCIFKGSSSYINPGYYWFNPEDGSFRTKRGRNKAHKVLEWEIA